MASENVAAVLLSLRQGVLDRHKHLAREQLDAAGAACARSTGVVDKNVRPVGDVENGVILGDRGRDLRHLKGDAPDDPAGRSGLAGRITRLGSERFFLDPLGSHAEIEQCGRDAVHHRKGAAEMNALRRDIWNDRGEERLVDAAPSPGPLFDFGIAHRGRDPQAAVARLQRRDFLLEGIFARYSGRSFV